MAPATRALITSLSRKKRLISLLRQSHYDLMALTIEKRCMVKIVQISSIEIRRLSILFFPLDDAPPLGLAQPMAFSSVQPTDGNRSRSPSSNAVSSRPSKRSSTSSTKRKLASIASPQRLQPTPKYPAALRLDHRIVSMTKLGTAGPTSVGRSWITQRE